MNPKTSSRIGSPGRIENPIIDREHTLAFRQHASYLHRRLSKGSLVEPAFAGLQDSSPRSALLSLHARVHEVSPSAWEDARLVQIWGPRGAVYVVPREDVVFFTVGRLPRDPDTLARIEAAMQRVSKITPKNPTRLSRQNLLDLRLGSITGKIRIRWDGSRISWWLEEPPETDSEVARLELARRFLRSLGPSTPGGLAWWAGVTRSDARNTFKSLAKELSEARLGSRPVWILKSDLASLQGETATSTVRLLPPGDPYLGADDRTLLVTQERLRAELWPKSVWPGALLAHGEIIGTWRRQQGRVIIRPWSKPDPGVVEAVRKEVESMPVESQREVRWERPLTR